MSTAHTLWYSSKVTNSFPLSFLPSKPSWFWWILSMNSYVLVFNPIFGWKTKKITCLLKVNRKSWVLNFIMLVISLISLALCNSVRKSICRKFLVPVYFRTIFGLFCSDIIYHHKIDNFPGKITMAQSIPSMPHFAVEPRLQIQTHGAAMGT